MGRVIKLSMAKFDLDTSHIVMMWELEGWVVDAIFNFCLVVIVE
jgi:hypothetical protein